MNIIERIRNDFAILTRSQQKVAMFILNNLVRTTFMTISQLSAAVGTSPMTIIRLAIILDIPDIPVCRTLFRKC
jgi:DNA-binding MurR/RpiR family transcriptional regulator